ncbi:NAD(P)H-hydrate dehydratase [Lentisphaerota bacterium ZTH]|nr:NAD(P)H-hydrate dehydratase [Lentisphaerota bacterium]WET06383.1 NAD(P)H-hydrate dehydratase [Lentisphaerota bacterium ZTH]
MKVISVEQMRELDRRTIEEYGTPGMVLMERAGFGSGETIVEYLSDNFYCGHVKRFVIICGKGNNGGDGYVVARYLHDNTDAEIVIYSVCELDQLGEDSRAHAELIVKSVTFSVKSEVTDSDFKTGDIIIDALLGTGISGDLKKPYDNYIRTVNASRLPVISLDIPSGLNGDDGEYHGDCIKADMTITMALPKLGLLKGHGPARCGLLRCIDIGIPDQYLSGLESDTDLFLMNDCAPLLKRIPMDSHKNSVGAVLVIGGSHEYFGAPFLTAVSALRTGAGMVRVAVPENIERIPDVPLSLILCKVKDNGKGYFSKESLPQILRLAAESDVIALGPGIGRHRDLVGFIREILKIDKPIVIDADALNVISDVPEIYLEKDSNILTPHPGEMKRLLEAFDLEWAIHDDKMTKALKLSQKIDSTIVLKGFRSVTSSPDGRMTVNASGCPALSTAGSGDCLTGIIAALAAKEEDSYKAAAGGVFIHGLAGEISSLGQRGLIADDLPDIIPAAMSRISPFA